jgi:hypothetical protein
MKMILITTFLVVPLFAFSQETYDRAVDFAEASLAVGTSRASLSLSYVHNRRFGKSDQIAVGIGGRFTSFVGRNLYYITAPAILTSGSTSPLIFFKENIVENIDSLLIRSPQINSGNLLINIEYAVSNKITAGFNIDAIGFSFGRKTTGKYINGSEEKMSNASPTSFNILLISDNDRGSLNSEFYARYKVRQGIALKAGAQFLFTEYTTETEVQQEPQKNDRFRNKSLLFSAGVSFTL